MIPAHCRRHAKGFLTLHSWASVCQNVPLPEIKVLNLYMARDSILGYARFHPYLFKLKTHLQCNRTVIVRLQNHKLHRGMHAL